MSSTNLDKEAEKLLDTISFNVAKIRKEKGISQLDLALEMGYKSAAYIGRIELRKDNHHFNIKQLYKISKILKVEICEFLQEPKKDERVK